MKLKRFLLVFGILALLLFSCSWENFYTPPANVPARDFWTIDVSSGEFRSITAELLADGRHARVWVERGAAVSQHTAKRVAREFDNIIFPRMMDVFGLYGNIRFQNQIIAQNTMELAHWLADGDGKVVILFLNIRGNPQPGAGATGVAGYFWGGDLLAIPNSNRDTILYIDANVFEPGTTDSNAVIVHEFQHLLNFVTSVLLRDRPMDLWINEGLSMAAIDVVYPNQESVNSVNWFNRDPSNQIQRGNNFFVWGNRSRESNLAILDDYVTAHLFFEWLRVQAGNTDIFHDIIASREFNHRAVTSAANRSISGHGFDNWETLLRTWLAANYINAPSGIFGYRNAPVLRDIRARTAPAVPNIQLYPGEGVFSITEIRQPLPVRSGNIRYAGLTSSTPWLNESETFPDGALLTFNSSTNTVGEQERGLTTGVAASVGVVPHSWTVGEPSTRPLTISLEDMLRLSGRGVNHEPEILKLGWGIFNND